MHQSIHMYCSVLNLHVYNFFCGLMGRQKLPRNYCYPYLHFVSLVHIPPEILAALRWNQIAFEGILPLVVVITIVNYMFCNLLLLSQWNVNFSVKYFRYHKTLQSLTFLILYLHAFYIIKTL